MSRWSYLARALTACIFLVGTAAFPFSDLTLSFIHSTLKEFRGSSYIQGGLSCSPHIVRVSDVHTVRKDITRPQVLISGEIHGDERVGPGVTIPLTQLLVWSAECSVQRKAESCAKLDNMQGVTSAQRTWLAFLATRRETIIVPTANCMGYMRSTRWDGRVDANRDFPYSRNNDRCFQSSSARLFKALMETNIIQTVVTFHGGMVALGYEWGSRNHNRPKDQSPDENAHRSIGELMGAYAGTFAGEKPYPVGRINTLIYPVEGGMEDWMYAAGWDKSVVRSCAGESGLATRVGGRRLQGVLVPAQESIVTAQAMARQSLEGAEASGAGVSALRSGAVAAGAHTQGPRHLQVAPAAENRAVVFLVETSDRKKPLDSTLGGSEKILDPNAPQNGHIPRNVRLTLAAIDMVQPYVCLSRIAVTPAGSRRGQERGSRQGARALQEQLPVSGTAADGPVPGTLSNATGTGVSTRGLVRKALEGRMGSSGPPTQRIDVDWYVGGGRTVDCTFLAWHRVPAVLRRGRDGETISTENWSAYLSSLDSPSQTERFKAFCTGSAESPEATATSGASANVFPLLAAAPQIGKSRWYGNSKDNTQSAPARDGMYAADDSLAPKSRFHASVMPSLPGTAGIPFPPGRYLLVTWAMVDQDFGAPQQGYPVEATPQSHLANARTNPAYRKQVGDRVVEGRVFWPSDPVAILVGEDGSVSVESAAMHCAWWDSRAITGADRASIGEAPEAEVQTERSPFDPAAFGPPAELRSSVNKLFVLTLGMLLITCMCCVCLYYHWRRNSIYAQLAGNKYVNFATFHHYRWRGSGANTPSSTPSTV